MEMREKEKLVDILKTIFRLLDKKIDHFMQNTSKTKPNKTLECNGRVHK